MLLTELNDQAGGEGHVNRCSTAATPTWKRSGMRPSWKVASSTCGDQHRRVVGSVGQHSGSITQGAAGSALLTPQLCNTSKGPGNSAHQHDCTI